MKKLLFFLFYFNIGLNLFGQEQVTITQEGADINLDKDKEFSELSFKEKFHLGGGFSGLSFGNPTSIGISPMVGYDVTPNITFGIGGTYQYYSIKTINGGRLRSDNIGGRVFVRNYLDFLNNLIGPGFLIGQVESFKDINTVIPYSYSTNVLVGIGMGPRRGFNFQVMYDLNYNKNYLKSSIYGSPIVVQVSGFIF